MNQPHHYEDLLSLLEERVSEQTKDGYDFVVKKYRTRMP